MLLIHSMFINFWRVVSVIPDDLPFLIRRFTDHELALSYLNIHDCRNIRRNSKWRPSLSSSSVQNCLHQVSSTLFFECPGLSSSSVQHLLYVWKQVTWRNNSNLKNSFKESLITYIISEVMKSGFYNISTLSSLII